MSKTKKKRIKKAKSAIKKAETLQKAKMKYSDDEHDDSSGEENDNSDEGENIVQEEESSSADNESDNESEQSSSDDDNQKETPKVESESDDDSDDNEEKSSDTKGDSSPELMDDDDEASSDEENLDEDDKEEETSSEEEGMDALDDEEKDSDDEEDESSSDDDQLTTPGSKRKAKPETVQPSKRVAVEKLQVFVGGLPKTTKSEAVSKFFRKRGVITNECRQKSGFFFLSVASEKDLQKALSLEGQKMGNASLHVERAKGAPKPVAAEAQQKADHDEKLQLFVKNLPPTTTQLQLKQLFPTCKLVHMPSHKAGGQAKGYAFVVFAREDDVVTAMKKHQGKDFNGRSLFLDRCGQYRKAPMTPTQRKPGATTPPKAKGEEGKTNVLFVKNVNMDTKQEDLRKLFNATAVRRPLKHNKRTGKPIKIGFCFIEFSSAQKAAKAQKKLNGVELDGRRLFVDYATPKPADRKVVDRPTDSIPPSKGKQKPVVAKKKGALKVKVPDPEEEPSSDEESEDDEVSENDEDETSGEEESD